MGVSISNKHSRTQQKQERVLTVMPIDRSALRTVTETKLAPSICLETDPV